MTFIFIFFALLLIPLYFFRVYFIVSIYEYIIIMSELQYTVFNYLFYFLSIFS